MTDAPLSTLVFSEILANVASTAPSPGGGAVGALTVSLGIACGLKAIYISLKHNPASASLNTAERELEQLSALALRLADMDGVAFEALLGAYKLPKDSDAEKQSRRREIGAKAAEAAIVGRRINQCAREVEMILQRVRDDISANITGDYAAAFALLRANSVIQEDNIGVNTSIATKFAQSTA